MKVNVKAAPLRLERRKIPPKGTVIPFHQRAID